MALRTRALVFMVVAGAIASLVATPAHAGRAWLHFFVYLAAVLLSSGMKIAMPKSEGTMSVNFPFILLGIVELSPLQAVCLAVCSVIAQCRFRVIKRFTVIQILFNVTNVTTATVLAWYTYAAMMRAFPEVAPALALAATVYFLANTVPLACILGWESKTSPVNMWLREFPWYLPFYLVGAMLAALANFIGWHFGWLTSLLLIPMIYTVYRAYRAQMAIVRDRERHVAEMEALLDRTIEGLSMAIEAKDHGTHTHLMRVRVYVAEIGKLMGLDRSQMQALFTASFLHDIGKLAVPEYIINKPGKLTPEEFQKMKIHPGVGADILERVQFPYPVVPIVRSHHEAWDGSGYPDGLKGEDIPIGARILTAVDCFDALASERPYRKAMSTAEAMAVLKSKAGTQFDPAIVALLEEHYPRLEELARRQCGEMVPLNTDIFVERGAAPGAGFQQSPQAAAIAAQGDSVALLAAGLREAQVVFTASQSRQPGQSARELSAMICRGLRPLVPFDCCAVYLEADDQLTNLYREGPLAHAFSDRRIPVGEGLSGWVVQSQRWSVNGNPTVEPNYRPESGAFHADSSALAIPLCSGDSRIFGVLTVYSVRQNAYTEDHLRLLEAMQFRLALALENALRGSGEQDEASLLPIADFESYLRSLDGEAARAKSSGEGFGIMVCDLPGLPEIAEQYGSAAAGSVLCAVFGALRRSSGSEALIARTTGSEFAMILPALNSAAVEQTSELMADALEEAVAGWPGAAALSMAWGSALCPRDGTTAQQLWRAADRDRYARGARALADRSADLLATAQLGVSL